MIIGPTAPTTAFPIGAKTDDPVQMYLNDIFTIAGNLDRRAGDCRFPAASTRKGLPVGLQIQGNHFRRSADPRTSRIATSRRPTGTARARRQADASMKWEVVIGLETHTQLSTRRRSSRARRPRSAQRRTRQASAVDIALPGVLPVLNQGAVERAIRFGLAVGGTINRRSVFARKNYFYPDLPKGYQICQYEIPVVQGGEVAIVSPTRARSRCGSRARTSRRTPASRLHEDFGMSHGMTGIDLNRAGTPLLEIVSEPDLRSAEEAVAYAQDAARAGALDRHLRRQHAGGQLPLRRQRLGAPDGRRRSSARAARSRT